MGHVSRATWRHCQLQACDGRQLIADAAHVTVHVHLKQTSQSFTCRLVAGFLGLDPKLFSGRARSVHVLRAVWI